MIAAASAGHLDMVKFLLDSGADVNAQDKDHITALMEAAIMGHKGTFVWGMDYGVFREARTHVIFCMPLNVGSEPGMGCFGFGFSYAQVRLCHGLSVCSQHDHPINARCMGHIQTW